MKPESKDSREPKKRSLAHAGTGEVEEILGTNAHGLEAHEVEARLARYGPNALEEARRPVSSPRPSAPSVSQPLDLPYDLLVATAVTLVPGEYIDAGVIAGRARAQRDHRLCPGVSRSRRKWLAGEIYPGVAANGAP
jgi:hypothetical protein